MLLINKKKIISNDMYISYSSYIHTINIVSSSIELLPPPFSHIACNAGIRCRSPYSYTVKKTMEINYDS